MPGGRPPGKRKKSNIGRRTNSTTAKRLAKKEKLEDETLDEKETRLANQREYSRTRRR